MSRRNRTSKLIWGAAVALAVFVATTIPASAGTVTVPWTWFALHPGPYCAAGSGDGTNDLMDGPRILLIQSHTASRKGSPGCPTASPGAFNSFSAQAKLMKLGTGGTFAVCASTLATVNQSGASATAGQAFVEDCGGGWYKVDARWRITYGGTAKYGNKLTDNYLHQD